MKNLLVIDGWWGSGKSVLRGLLDGHSQIFVCPVQDSVPGAFARSKELSKWLLYKDTEALREMCAKESEYFRIERFHHRGTFHSDTSKNNRDYQTFDFDYYGFDKHFIEHLLKHETWSPEIICEQLYSSFHEFWPQYPSRKDEIKYLTTMANNHATTPESLMRDYENAKLIYVRRDPAGIISTRAGRKPVEGDYRSESWEQLSVKKLISSGEVERIVLMQQRVEQLQKEFPHRLMVIDFEPLVLEWGKTIDEVRDFLAIKDESILKEFSYCGKKIVSSSGLSYVGSINDKPCELLESTFFNEIIKREKRAQNGNLKKYYAYRAFSKIRKRLLRS
ncbi:MAG: sulfotransferase [Akkermansiaceae bacterium]